ncbi:hypothetical protein D3C84_1197340 [compost metagenome]
MVFLAVGEDFDFGIFGLVVDQFEVQVGVRQPFARCLENRLFAPVFHIVDEADAQGAPRFPEFVERTH